MKNLFASSIHQSPNIEVPEYRGITEAEEEAEDFECGIAYRSACENGCYESEEHRGANRQERHD